MEVGHFYYIDDKYFIDFSDKYLMKNKETVNGHVHDRPCFYTFQDTSTGLYWMIPFSSQVSKFKKIYNSKIKKYKRCDTIVFGEVLGHGKAFLIQNMCPITPEYIKNEYFDSNANYLIAIKKYKSATLLIITAYCDKKNALKECKAMKNFVSKG